MRTRGKDVTLHRGTDATKLASDEQYQSSLCNQSYIIDGKDARSAALEVG